eukprot:468154_1
MASKLNDWKEHRRAKSPQPNSVLYKTTLTLFHLIYTMRSTLSFHVFFKNTNVTKATVISLGFIIMPLFTLIAPITAKPIEKKYLTAQIGMGLYVFGSIIHTLAEFHRFIWKSNKTNTGKLFTKGLYSISRNPNYLGDILLYEGWYLYSNNKWNQVIPIMMAGNFAMTLIPTKEKYLAAKYATQWNDYTNNVKSLIPYVL